MRPLVLAVLAVLSLLAQPAALSAQGLELLARVGGGPFSRGPVEERVGEPVEVVVRLPGETPGVLPPGAVVRFRRVVPRLAHRETPSPNPGDPVFSNTVMLGPRHGQWLGVDTLEYEALALDGDPRVRRTGPALVLTGASPPRRPDGPPSASRVPHAEGAGTVWLTAEVALPDGRVLHAPGAADTDRLGLSPRVLRVSYRTGDDFLGWLSSYFDVPFVFGSTPRQVSRFVGVDCADAMVAGRRLETDRPLAFTSVGGIGQHARSVSDVLVLDADGTVRDPAGVEVSLAWGTDVRPGDLVAIDYSNDPGRRLPRAWDHIGALVADDASGGVPGQLDGADLLRHMGRSGLTDQPLVAQGPIRFRLWRFSRD